MIKRIALILSLLAVAGLTGCGRGGSPPPPPDEVVNMEPSEPSSPQQQSQPAPVVGFVSAIYDGTNAFVGSVRATEKQPIHLNEHFYTGPGTKMEVTLDNGGIILLDQLTDPNFFTTARCFWIRLTSGTMTVRNKNPMCAEAGSAKFGQHSYVLYQANGRTTTVAVFEGQVATIEPPGITVNAGQMLTVQNGETTGPQPMNQDTINKLQAWIPRVIL